MNLAGRWDHSTVRRVTHIAMTTKLPLRPAVAAIAAVMACSTPAAFAQTAGGTEVPPPPASPPADPQPTSPVAQAPAAQAPAVLPDMGPIAPTVVAPATPAPSSGMVFQSAPVVQPRPAPAPVVEPMIEAVPAETAAPAARTAQPRASAQPVAVQTRRAPAATAVTSAPVAATSAATTAALPNESVYDDAPIIADPAASVAAESMSTMDDEPARPSVATDGNGDDLMWWVGGAALLGIAGLGAGALMMRRPDSRGPVAANNAPLRASVDPVVRPTFDRDTQPMQRAAMNADAIPGTLKVPNQKPVNGHALTPPPVDVEPVIKQPTTPTNFTAETVTTAKPAPSVSVMPNYSPRSNGTGGRIIGRHERAALIGPSEDNPFLTRKNRVRRARFYDRQEAVAAMSRKPAYGVMDRVQPQSGSGHPSAAQSTTANVTLR